MMSHIVKGDAFLDSVYDNLVNAQETLKEVAIAVNAGLKTVANTVKFVENFIESTVEEDCVYKCPGKKIPVRNPNHTPKANGCGSLGVFFEKEDLSRAEMVDCCNDHDICYDTCGRDKEDCDKIFKRCLYNTCKITQNEMDILTNKKCKGGAKLLYTATVALGCTPFKEAQHSACRCVPVKAVPHQRNEL
ncbi:group XIIA secretory phospholipase A2-like [Homarus americanus]|uniref:group XIIA secretory phospholipase A2-like n=1 Tax=Homarus americanus TaxID=6706 RepID=UPI001C48625E|nr:group XIIA secretory phospholipase A2-like [Homarus americanus]